MATKSTKPATRGSESDDAAWYTTPEGRRQTQREFERALRIGDIILSNGLKVPKSDPKFLERLMHVARLR
jgi:hypothetical protein